MCALSLLSLSLCAIHFSPQTQHQAFFTQTKISCMVSFLHLPLIVVTTTGKLLSNNNNHQKISERNQANKQSHSFSHNPPPPLPELFFFPVFSYTVFSPSTRMNVATNLTHTQKTCNNKAL
jgi:hypothetical protein